MGWRQFIKLIIGYRGQGKKDEEELEAPRVDLPIHWCSAVVSGQRAWNPDLELPNSVAAAEEIEALRVYLTKLLPDAQSMEAMRLLDRCLSPSTRLPALPRTQAVLKWSGNQPNSW